MTRETKIGLLVGLAFIIVIGILLSDHFHNMEPPPANISVVGNNARQAVREPGTGDPIITHYTPTDAPPHSPMALRDELNPVHNPVVTLPRNNTPATNNPTRTDNAPLVNNTIDPRLLEAARRNGEDIVPANPTPVPQPAPGPTGPVASLKSYKAQSGDTVSRMASHFLGANNRSNRQAIIDANASLKDDPDTIIVGHTYMIPTSAVATAVAPIAPTAPAVVPPAAGEQYYTVESGDSLWAIANDQLDDPNAVDAIKELNKGILKGENHDVVRPGMKLRLPAKAVALAN